MANAIAGTLDANLFEMISETPDTSADLNWTDSGSRVNAEYYDPAKQDVKLVAQNPYPTDHSTLVAQAREEQDQDVRPAIKDTIADFDSYDTVFIGYPIWRSDLPQILYTFFDTYDFSVKTVIPFSTHGGSSFAGTPATIQRLEPNAKMLDGLTISRNSIQDAEQEIIGWVNSLIY